MKAELKALTRFVLGFAGASVFWIFFFGFFRSISGGDPHSLREMLQIILFMSPFSVSAALGWLAYCSVRDAVERDKKYNRRRED